MPNFRYEAIDSAGNMVSGVQKAELIQEVEEWLLKQNMSPINIVAGSDAGSAAGSTGSAASTRPGFLERMQHKVTLDDQILFCEQIATMLMAGVALLKALRIMIKQVENPVLRKVATDMADNIEGGKSFSEAVSQYPQYFSPLFQSMIRVGEESGSLDNSFEYMARLFENEKEIKEKIKAVTRYPKILCSAMGLAIIFLMSFVVPRFLTMFSGAKVELPLATRLLVGISNFFENNFFLIMVAIAAGVVAYRYAMKNDNFVLARDRLLLKLPVAGQLSVKIHMTRFCKIFAVLTSSGVGIIRTIELSGAAVENRYLTGLIGEVGGELEEGNSFYDALSKHSIFPAMVVQMVTIGEETGELDTMMDKVAAYYDRETNYAIKTLSAMIEPILLAAMGLMVGFLALAIFSPMWSMMDVMR